MIEQDKVNRMIDLINKSYGYGKEGTHKQVCDMCGFEYDEPNDLNILLLSHGCPYCNEIYKLNNFMSEYKSKQFYKRPINELFVKYMNEGRSYKTIGIKYDNKNSYVNKKIEDIDKVLRYCSTAIEPQLSILDSIYIQQNHFWDDNREFLYYVHFASLQLVCTKIHEFTNSSNSSSISIHNIIKSMRKEINQLKNRKIIEQIQFDGTDDVIEIKYDPFPFNELLDLIDYYINNYLKDIFEIIREFRNHECAHLDEFDFNKTLEKSCYCDIKRAYSFMKYMYSALSYAIAPDISTSYINGTPIKFDRLLSMDLAWRKENNL